MSSIKVALNDGNNVILKVTPQPRIDLRIDRGGGSGGGGGGAATSIGGFPIVIVDPQPQELLMFVGSEWANIAQTEITDGGAF